MPVQASSCISPGPHLGRPLWVATIDSFASEVSATAG